MLFKRTFIDLIAYYYSKFISKTKKKLNTGFKIPVFSNFKEKIKNVRKKYLLVSFRSFTTSVE